MQQHDCIASLVGKASSENKGAGRVGVVPRIVLVIGFGVCVRTMYMYSCYVNHSHTKIAPLVTKITYIKMDPLRSIRHGFANG